MAKRVSYWHWVSAYSTYTRRIVATGVRVLSAVAHPRTSDQPLVYVYRQGTRRAASLVSHGVPLYCNPTDRDATLWFDTPRLFASFFYRIFTLFPLHTLSYPNASTATPAPAKHIHLPFQQRFRTTPHRLDISTLVPPSWLETVNGERLLLQTLCFLSVPNNKPGAWTRQDETRDESRRQVIFHWRTKDIIYIYGKKWCMKITEIGTKRRSVSTTNDVRQTALYKYKVPAFYLTLKGGILCREYRVRCNFWRRYASGFPELKEIQYSWYRGPKLLKPSSKIDFRSTRISYIIFFGLIPPPQ